MAYSRQPNECFFYRDVAHLLGCLASALNANQFVIAPEGAIEEQNVASIELIEKAVVEMRNGGHICESWARRRSNNESQGSFAERELRLPLRRDVSRIVRPQRKRTAAHAGVFVSGIEKREGKL